MLTKLEIIGDIEIKTGLHIGAGDDFSVIGAVDTSVVKDAISELPYIPGSTLKGKLRHLLAKKWNRTPFTDRKNDDQRIKRLFGSAGNAECNEYPRPSRLIFSDLVVNNVDALYEKGLQNITEVKAENTINPITSVANPRKLERVVRGANFPLSIIYNMDDISEVEEDIQLLKEGIVLLEYDYLGGHGSRGYGKIVFNNLDIECAVGDIEDDLLVLLKNILKAK